jgi:hypothetical protein
VAEAEPVEAAFSGEEAGEAEIVGAVVAARTVFVVGVLNVGLFAAGAGD